MNEFTRCLGRRRSRACARRAGRGRIIMRTKRFTPVAGTAAVFALWTVASATDAVDPTERPRLSQETVTPGEIEIAPMLESNSEVADETPRIESVVVTGRADDLVGLVP